MVDEGVNEKLAIHGGKPAKTVAYQTSDRFTRADALAAYETVLSQHLWQKQGGTRVLEAEKTVCEMWNVKHAVCCSSGTAAVHTALAAVGVAAGDEVIVNPLTDWGSVAGILALGAIPVFADIEEQTYSLDPEKVEAAITDKTRAIEVVHLSGYPAKIREIVEIAKGRGIKVVEDCAQAHHAQVGGKFCGTIGDVGTFSVNDSKLVSCGEGGIVITDDDEIARVARLFIDKGYTRNAKRGRTDVEFLGFNFRMSELSAAVLNTQLKELPRRIETRRGYATYFRKSLGEVPGYTVLETEEDVSGSYWFLLGHLDLEQFSISRSEIVEALKAEGIPVWPALSPARTLYGTTAIKEMVGGSKGYCADDFPVAERITDSVLPMHCSPFFAPKDAYETAMGLRKVLGYFHK